MISYGFTKGINKPFEETVKIVTEELKKEGFGILTRIDVKDKFKEKLKISTGGKPELEIERSKNLQEINLIEIPDPLAK